MNILLTGATGFIGKHLIKKMALQHNVYALVRESSQYADLPIKGAFIFRDNIDELQENFQKHSIESIVHLAALYLAQHCPNDIKKMIDANVYLGVALLEAACKTRVKWFLNAGTYWQHSITDSAEYSPVNLYAASKQAFVDMAKYYTEIYPLTFVTLKLFDTYGPNDTRRKILNLFKDISASNEQLQLSPGNQLMDLLYIDDAVDGFMHLVSLLNECKSLAPDYALYSQQRYSLKEIAVIFERVATKKLNLEWGGRPYREREIMEPWTKGAPLPGWQAAVSLEQGIKKILENSHNA